MRVFEAKYKGHCTSESCRYGDGEIRPGDDVEFVDDELMHRECATAARRDAEIPRCATCFTHHRGDC